MGLFDNFMNKYFNVKPIQPEKPIIQNSVEVTPQQPSQDYYSFNVSGIAYNDDELQNVIKSLLKLELLEKYNGFTNRDLIEYNMDLSIFESQKLNGVKIEKDRFDGKDALKISIDDGTGKYHHIGYVPKKDIKEVQKLIDDKDNLLMIQYEIIGGKRKFVNYDDETDKLLIVEKEFNYGVIIYIRYKINA